MQRKAAPFDKFTMKSASYRAKNRVDEFLERAAELAADTRKDERLKKQECKACFYFQRLGGASITEQPCACCHKSQLYGSTNTDVLCVDCAIEHDLCKHCGGDIASRPNRMKFPDLEKGQPL